MQANSLLSHIEISVVDSMTVPKLCKEINAFNETNPI